MIFEIFENYRASGTTDLAGCVETIKSGELNGVNFSQRIGRIRKAKSKEEADKLKKTLPAFAQCGTFEGGKRSNETLKNYTGLIQLDFDHLSEQELDNVRNKIISDPYAKFGFVSPSGRGYKIFIETDSPLEQHKEACAFVYRHAERHYGTRPDRSVNDPARLCYYSEDPNCYYNPDAQKFPFANQNSEDSFFQFDKAVKTVESRSEYFPGNRNNFAYQLANEANRRGIKEDETLEFMAAQYDLERRELERTVRGAFKRNGGEHGKLIRSEESLVDFLLSKGLVYNVVTNRLETPGKVMDDRDINSIFIQARAMLKPPPSKTIFEATVNSSNVPSYNPILSYFDQLRLRDVSGNPLKEFLWHIDIKDRALMEPFIVKWLLMVIASVYGHVPDLILVLIGKQGNGKTEFFSRLLPPGLAHFFAVDSLERGKDSEMLMCSKMIILDDEFGGLSKKDAAKLKATASKTTFSLRPPYGKTNIDFKRLAVLCGTSNHVHILNDPTGNRRIVPVEMLSRDFEISDSIKREDLWAQLLEMYDNREDDYIFKPTQEDYVIINDISNRYQFTNQTRELISRYFHGPGVSGTEFMTATDVSTYISSKCNMKLSPITVGKELVNMGYTHSTSRQRHGYMMEKSARR